jgi:hypothetical protein
MIGTRQLNESRILDRRSKMAASLDPNSAIARAVKHERRSTNTRQEISHIHIAHGFEHSLDGAGT